MSHVSGCEHFLNGKYARTMTLEELEEKVDGFPSLNALVTSVYFACHANEETEAEKKGNCKREKGREMQISSRNCSRKWNRNIFYAGAQYKLQFL